MRILSYSNQEKDWRKGDNIIMKPSLQFSVPCLEVKEDNKPPTFAYLFYELPLPELPIKCPPFFINNGWCNGQGKFQQEIKILSPDKKEVIIETGKQEFVLDIEYVPQLIVNQFDQVLFKETGYYWVQIFLNSSLELEYPLTVRLVSGMKQAETKQPPVSKEQPKPVAVKSATPASPLNAPIFQDS